MGRIGAAGQSVLHRGRIPGASRLPSPSPPLKMCAISSRTVLTASPSSSSGASAREAMHVLCGLIVGGGKMVRFPLIAEEITEYSLLESCFLAALKFFEKILRFG